MDLLKLEEDISERLMIELGDELRTEHLIFATTFVMEEIKKHLEVKYNVVLDDVIVSGKDCKTPMREFGSDKCLICGKKIYEH